MHIKLYPYNFTKRWHFVIVNTGMNAIRDYLINVIICNYVLMSNTRKSNWSTIIPKKKINTNTNPSMICVFSFSLFPHGDVSVNKSGKCSVQVHYTLSMRFIRSFLRIIQTMDGTLLLFNFLKLSSYLLNPHHTRKIQALRSFGTI